jgi:sporulation protein YlmC with PRC-barrel domain
MKARSHEIVALACAMCLIMTSALHAQTQGDLSSEMIGQPIYTSDGIRIGQVTSIARYKGQKMLVGEVGLTLGLGTRLVLIPNDIANIQKDRVILTISSDRVSNMLGAEK